ncbi:PIN domain-containing protein [Thermococcus guaymasensis]|uniref:PIN domain-containing protein n=1 Tax=Thermococcus guaymasensis TaxID=110164 RepID=UPI000AFD2291
MAKPLRPELFYMDTSAMIALLVRDDPEHERALSFFRDAVREGSVFVIGRPTLMEFLNGVAKHVGKDVAEEQYASTPRADSYSPRRKPKRTGRGHGSFSSSTATSGG